jgi:hypothetical protein
MENFEIPRAVNPITINTEMKTYLAEAARWGKFLAIIGYIGVGFLVLAGIILMIVLSFADGITDVNFPVGIVGIIYIALAVVYYFPVHYLHRFSASMKQGLSADDEQYVLTGFKNLKSLFRFLGILTIVILSIYALILIVVLPLSLIVGGSLLN